MNPLLFRLPSKPSAERNQSDKICNLYKAREQLIFT